MIKKYALDSKNLTQSTSLVKKVTNYKSIALSVFICLLSLAMIFLTSLVEDKSSSLYFGGITLTILLLIVGFYRLINNRLHLVYVPTNSKTVSGSVYFDKTQLERLKSVLSETPSANLKDFEFAQTGNSRLDYIVAHDSNFVAIQLYEFIPYNFEAVSDIIIYDGDKAHNFSKFLIGYRY